jgi:hypothetical protein
MLPFEILVNNVNVIFAFVLLILMSVKEVRPAPK